jgi:hypothetical protein
VNNILRSAFSLRNEEKFRIPQSPCVSSLLLAKYDYPSTGWYPPSIFKCTRKIISLWYSRVGLFSIYTLLFFILLLLQRIIITFLQKERVFTQVLYYHISLLSLSTEVFILRVSCKTYGMTYLYHIPTKRIILQYDSLIVLFE